MSRYSICMQRPVKQTNERTKRMRYDKIIHVSLHTIYYTIMSVHGKWKSNAVHDTGIMGVQPA